MKKFLRFFHYLGYSTVLAGCAFASFFGFPIPFLRVFEATVTNADGTTEIVKKALLDNNIDITLMLILSVAIGFVQIVYAIGVKGYILIKDGRVLDAFLDAGMWIVTVVSGVGTIAFVALGMEGLVTPCLYVLLASLVILAATSGRGNKTLVGKIAGGLFDVYGLTSYVGDLVSYTRLVALALSGGYIAYAFNMMGWEIIPAGIPRIVFGTLIVVLGGAINMGLSLLGAYVHTCRLQFVEFFGKFYEGGGVPFKPLSAQNAFIQIKEQND